MGPDASDLSLVRRVQRGERGAYDLLVLKYQHKVVKLVMRYLRDPADAEDVAQDVLAKLTQKMASFQYDETRCFRAWLKTITQRVLSDLIANRKRSLGGPAIPLLDTRDARADLERLARARDALTAHDMIRVRLEDGLSVIGGAISADGRRLGLVSIRSPESGSGGTISLHKLPEGEGEDHVRHGSVTSRTANRS